MFFSKRRFRAEVLKVERIGSSLIKVTLLPRRKLNFEPGQFISIEIPPRKEGDKPLRRCYSIANAPEQSSDAGIEIFARVVLGGRGSNYLANLQPGQTVNFRGPFGDFILKSSTTTPVCFIATGTGVGPVRSMLASKRMLNHRSQKSLIVGAGFEKELIYAAELVRSGVESFACLTKEKREGFYFGRVTDFLIEAPPHLQWHKTHFYLCGNGEMIHEVRALLLKMGVPIGNVFAESFGAHKTRRAVQELKSPSVLFQSKKKVG